MIASNVKTLFNTVVVQWKQGRDPNLPQTFACCHNNTFTIPSTYAACKVTLPGLDEATYNKLYKTTIHWQDQHTNNTVDTVAQHEQDIFNFIAIVTKFSLHKQPQWYYHAVGDARLEYIVSGYVPCVKLIQINRDARTSKSLFRH